MGWSIPLAPPARTGTMLRTRERSLLLETLRPPVGYALERAVGTSYTLDLPALLAVPLAFTYFNYQDEEGEPTRDPVALLEALRRHAQHITLFCQAGAIAVPKPQLGLLAYLESSVVQVRARRQGGIFHPKAWLVRYAAEGKPARYRFLCLSRNLTFDRAWDTCLVLEGELGEEGEEIDANRPLGDFVKALPGLAVRRVAPGVRKEAVRMAKDVLRVPFEAPKPFREVAFHPFGLGRGSEWPFPPGSRSLVASPFLSKPVVDRLSRKHGLSLLVSRPEELEALGPEALPEDGTFVLSPGAQLDAQEGSEDGEEDGEKRAAPPAESPDAALHGLHAKIFLVEYWRHAYLFVGSANATSAAFERNVELLVELVGPKGKCGIDALLGSEEDQRKDDGLRSLLQPYDWRKPEEVDAVQQELDRAAALAAQEIGAADLSARVLEAEPGGPYDLELQGELPPLPEGGSLTVWPATLSSHLARAPEGKGSSLATFDGVSFDALTAFWAFELRLQRKGREALRRFVVSVPLEDAPADRPERLLRSFLKDRRQVLRLLLLLLSEEALDVAQLVEGDGSQGAGGWLRMAGWHEPTLLEALLESLVGDPRRLDQAARLIEDLSRTEEGRELLPAGLEEIWGPVWGAREGAAG